VWLDATVSSLGAAAVLAVVLSPVLASALAGSFSTATAVAVAYPMLDLLFIATVTGLIAVRGVRGGDRLALLMVGLMLNAVADVIYALQVTAKTYVIDSPLYARVDDRNHPHRTVRRRNRSQRQVTCSGSQPGGQFYRSCPPNRPDRAKRWPRPPGSGSCW